MATQLGNISFNNNVPKDSEVVHLTGNETINGTKTFTSNLLSLRSGSSVSYLSRFSGTARGTAPTNTKTVEYRLEDANGNTVNDLIQHWNIDGGTTTHIRAYKADGTYINIASFGASADGSTVTAKGTALAAVGMPSNSFVDNIMPLTNGATYTAPSNGYVSIMAYQNGSSSALLRLTGAGSYGNVDRCNTGEGTLMQVGIPVKKGTVVTLYCANVITGEYSRMRFIKADAEVA